LPTSISIGPRPGAVRSLMRATIVRFESPSLWT
jgi:hypothetical protein